MHSFFNSAFCSKNHNGKYVLYRNIWSQNVHWKLINFITAGISYEEWWGFIGKNDGDLSAFTESAIIILLNHSKIISKVWLHDRQINTVLLIRSLLSINTFKVSSTENMCELQRNKGKLPPRCVMTGTAGSAARRSNLELRRAMADELKCLTGRKTRRTAWRRGRRWRVRSAGCPTTHVGARASHVAAGGRSWRWRGARRRRPRSSCNVNTSYRAKKHARCVHTHQALPDLWCTRWSGEEVVAVLKIRCKIIKVLRCYWIRFLRAGCDGM